MALILKEYQTECLRRLGEYLALVENTGDPAAPFFDITRRPYLPIEQLPQGMPYVCFRVPTGGGKTLLAAHALSTITRTLLRQDRAVVLWLAPTNTIVDQTIRALQDRRHPYREALDAAFGGQVTVLSASSALYMQRPTLDGSTVIIVSTLAALRVTDTEGRKFYEANGNLMPHFTGLDERQRQEIANADDPSLVTPSLANVLRLRHPIVIMDEAHNARTALSFDTLERFAPACILELTATPETDHNPKKGLFASNVLHHVSALELKEDAMIKLPIRLQCLSPWKTTVQAALRRQGQLKEAALNEERDTGEYIRPIVLFQAQNESEHEETVTAEVLKQTLIDDFKVVPEQIAIATGKKDEIEGKNILSRDCPIECIITVQKLKEGWDCPFAYILCTVTNLQARTAVEQMLGRVLRLPHAKKKVHDALNHAYAYVASQETHKTAASLVELLENHGGFSHFDASVSIQEEQPYLPGGLFGEEVSVPVSTTPDLTPAPVDLRAKVSFDGQTKHLTWQHSEPMTEGQKVVLQKCFKKEEDKQAIDALCQKSRGKGLAPAAQRQAFLVPQLMLRTGDKAELFEDQFREEGWDVTKADAALLAADFELPKALGQVGLIDIDKSGDLKVSFISEIQQQLALFERGPTTTQELAIWMAQTLQPVDLRHADTSVFLLGLIKYVMDIRGLTLPQLLSARFRLLDAAARRIDRERRKAMRASYQQFLLPDVKLEVTVERCFEFPLRSVYPAPRIYAGAFTFTKHYYQNIANMNGEEAQCAALIDGHAKVKFWVRNLVRSDFSFWLPTSTDRFYPDFVAQLTDGRFFVIEYKGAHMTPEEYRDSAEKQRIGQVWEERSKGTCLFRMVTLENMAGELAALG